MNTNKDNKAKLRDADAKQRRLEEMGSCNRLQRLRGCVTSKNYCHRRWDRAVGCVGQTALPNAQGRKEQLL